MSCPVISTVDVNSGWGYNPFGGAGMRERMEPARLVPTRAGDRLNSWKDIAAYLGREQRTVQRWEAAEGLPVHRLQHGKAGSVYALKSEIDAWMAQRSSKSSVQPSATRPSRRRKILITSALVLLVAVAATGGYNLYRYRWPPHSNYASPVSLTSHPGAELDARLSPNGTQFVYVWNGEAEDNFDIYVRMVTGGASVRLTTDPAPDYSPAWSPDGASIAFLRRTSGDKATLLVVPALGGREHRIGEVRSAAWAPWSRPGPCLAWSSDGRWLVTSGLLAASTGDVLVRMSAQTGDLKALTSLPAKTAGDVAPALSPDGTTVAFSRLLSWGKSELCLLPVSATLLPAGEVRTLPTGSSWNASPAWSPDGRSLVFSAGSMEAPYLARIGVTGSAVPGRLHGGDYGWMPSLVRKPEGRTLLVYTQHFESVNIWRELLNGTGGAVLLVSSAHWSYEPAWSRDGQRIVFLSDRTGYGEVWVADADGKHAEQWTFLKQPRLGSPRFSPDGGRIAFTAPGAQGSSIHIIDAPGAAPRAVAGAEEAGYLTWAPDGRTVYFSSSRGGGYNIWRIPAEGGEATRITQDRGRVPAVSSDGQYLYFLKLASADGRNDLWRLPLGGGYEEKVLDFVDAYSLGEAGIAFKYYRPGAEPVGPYLEFYSFATGKTERLPTPAKPLRYGVALSPDGRYLLHAQTDYEVSDLMLVDDFR